MHNVHTEHLHLHLTHAYIQSNVHPGLIVHFSQYGHI